MMQTADHDFYHSGLSRTADAAREATLRAPQSGQADAEPATRQPVGMASRMMNVIAVAIDATLGRYDR